MEEEKKKIRSFKDLDVFQNSYSAMLLVFKHILPKLPPEEKYDLRDQLQRSSKAVPRLIAEGHSKRHQKRGFQKYLDDALAESNETTVSLLQARDLYPQFVDVDICNELLFSYDVISRQTYNLSVAWTKFTEQRTLSANDNNPNQQPNHTTKNQKHNQQPNP